MGTWLSQGPPRRSDGEAMSRPWKRPTDQGGIWAERRTECMRKPPCGRCGACRRRKESDKLAMHIISTNLKLRKQVAEPECTCAMDDDAPFGGHKIRCPRYGKRPL